MEFWESFVIELELLEFGVSGDENFIKVTLSMQGPM